MTIKAILSEYDQKVNEFKAMEEKLCNLFTDLIKEWEENGIEIHLLSSRVKDKDNLERKIQNKNVSDGKVGEAYAKYKYLNDITDIVGIRIITKLEDDVDKVAREIENHFEIDEKNSVDKRPKAVLLESLLENETVEEFSFGYSSLHIIASLSAEHHEFPGYSEHIGKKFEIQIRSILQHSWADIQHGLDYKSDEKIPSIIKRRLARLSGLLELADEEFSEIVSDIHKYRKDIRLKIINSEYDLEINIDTLKYYIEENEKLRKMDELWKEKVGSESLVYNENLLKKVNKCMEIVNITSLNHLNNLLIKEEEVTLYIFNKLFKVNKKKEENSKPSKSAQGTSLLILSYIIVIKEFGNESKEELSIRLELKDNLIFGMIFENIRNNKGK